MKLKSANEHVPEIERRIRVAKERARCFRNSLPFNIISRLLLIHIVFFSVKMLNYSPKKGGVSTVYSPKTIMSGETLNYKRNLAVNIDQYRQVHEEGTPRNVKSARAKSETCLGPSGNTPGGFKFMILHSENNITIRIWDAIPIPDTFISQVNELEKGGSRTLYFYRPQRPYYWI